MTRTLRTATVVALVVLLAACGADDPESADPTTTTTTAESTTTTEDLQVVSERFDIGAGRALFLTCRGVGSPTMFFESGDQDDSGYWSRLMRALDQETRTCAYDRAGTGRSTPAAGCRSIDEIIGDLEALLEVAEVEGPFIWVGASGGGYLAAEMATRHADETVGLATFDTFKAITSAPPGVFEEIACDAPDNTEHRDYAAVEHAVWDDRTEIGDFPLTVFTNDYGDAAQYDEIGNVGDQQGWFVLSPNHKQVVVDSGHTIASNEPDLALAELLDLLEAARERL